MGFETPQVDDLVEDLVSAFREGLVHFIEELDAKLQQPGVQELEKLRPGSSFNPWSRRKGSYALPPGLLFY